METGCYVLDLVCDATNCKGQLPEHLPPMHVQFTGVSLAQCRRMARSRGWKTCLEKKHLCPLCAVELSEGMRKELS
jgi:hypothetical protein